MKKVGEVTRNNDTTVHHTHNGSMTTATVVKSKTAIPQELLYDDNAFFLVHQFEV